MTSGIRTFIVPVKDLSAARSLYTTLLGVQPYTDAPYYVGFRVGDTELGLDPNGHAQGMHAPIAYWPVEDLEDSVRRLKDAGASGGDIRSVGGGRRIALLTDADGNAIGLVAG